MKKTIPIYQWFLITFFFLTITVAIFQYAWWFWVAPLLPGEDNTSAYLTGIKLLVIYGLAAVAWNYTKNLGWKIALFFSSVSLLMANIAYIGWFKPRLVDSITCNRNTYFLTDHLDYWFSDRSYVQITKWRGLYYKRIYWYYSLSANELLCDEKEKKMKAFTGSFLDLSDNTNIFDSETVTHYELLEEIILNNLAYSLYTYTSHADGVELQEYLLTECEPNKAVTCKDIPIAHSSPSTDAEEGSLIADLGTNEIYILFDGKIHSAHKNKERKFDPLAFEKKYHVAGYSNEDVYTYILFECTPYSGDNCYYIPFSYYTAEPQAIKLKVDKYITKTHRLFVYIGGELVFVYDVIYDKDQCQRGCPHSQCLAEGCTTPGQ